MSFSQGLRLMRHAGGRLRTLATGGLCCLPRARGAAVPEPTSTTCGLWPLRQHLLPLKVQGLEPEPPPLILSSVSVTGQGLRLSRQRSRQGAMNTIPPPPPHRGGCGLAGSSES